MFPAKGDGSIGCFLTAALTKVFNVQKKAKSYEAVCVYGINVWRRSPAGSQRQTVDDRGKEPVLNQSLVQQTEAFSG